MLLLIAAVTLLVSGTGIMNIMLATVSARTQEIGIRKALGATNRTIRLQFLAEAIIISLVGGTIGVDNRLGPSVLAPALHRLHDSYLRAISDYRDRACCLVGISFGTFPADPSSPPRPSRQLTVRIERVSGRMHRPQQDTAMEHYGLTVKNNTNERVT